MHECEQFEALNRPANITTDTKYSYAKSIQRLQTCCYLDNNQPSIFSTEIDMNGYADRDHHIGCVDNANKPDIKSR